MESASVLIRPQTFEIGLDYVYRQKLNLGQEPRLVSVRFVNYDPCNAFVIVGTKTGSVWRCSRDDIFLETLDLLS